MGAQQSKITPRDRAILDMKLQRDKLKRYQRNIQATLDRESEIAQQCLAKGDKRRALLALRQRKFQQGLLEKTEEQLSILEQLTSNVEFALVEKDVLFGLEQGNRVLKQIHREISLEKAEKILEDTAESIAYQEEVSMLVSQNISNADEEEVLEEYNRLERLSHPQLPDVPNSIILPETPDHKMTPVKSVERARQLAS